MSDLQDLIHRNAQLAYDQGFKKGVTQDYYAGMTQGRIEERERILGKINDLINAVVDYTLTPSQYDEATRLMAEIIKGEQK